MTEEIRENAIVYNRSGEKARYIAHLHGQHLVRPIMVTLDYEGEEQDEESEHATFWPAAFLKPPVNKIAEDVQALLDQRNALQKEIQEKREELRSLDAPANERAERIKRHKATERLDDFLQKKITHVAVLTHDYEIKTFEEAFTERGERDIKLLSLFGRSNGDLVWKINQYYDGSGSWTEAAPCSSEDEARAAIVDRLRSDIASYDPERPYWLNQIVRNADKFGVGVPPELRESLRQYKLDQARKNSNHVREQLTKYDAEIAALEAEAPQ